MGLVEAAPADLNNSVQQVVEVKTDPPVEEPKPAEPEKVQERTVEKKVVSQSPKPTPSVSSDKQTLMQQAGIPESEWAAVDYIISRESGWRHLAWNGSGSGAYGLCQSLPASKMATAGADYMTNPVTQLRWCDGYAKSRYGGWWSAQVFWQNNHWW
jgi:hypothetical protein